VYSVLSQCFFLGYWAEVFCYTTAKDMKRTKCLHIKRRGQFTISLLRALVENITILIMIPLPLSAFRPPRSCVGCGCIGNELPDDKTHDCVEVCGQFLLGQLLLHAGSNVLGQNLHQGLACQFPHEIVLDGSPGDVGVGLEG